MRFSRILVALVFLLVIGVAFGHEAGRLLVVNEPAKADVIIVLAGETKSRPELALKLLHQGYAPHVFIDVEKRNEVYDELVVDLAERYIHSRGEASRVSVCAIEATSTVSEVHDVNRCLQEGQGLPGPQAHSVLVVTSAFHTRRALMILTHGLPQYQFHIAAAATDWQFGEKWWTDREWAKTTFDEWLKIAWFEMVDRWRQTSKAG